ncbi:MAG: four-carbon acid sugar kinase family protein [Anaerolineae bacterium]
MPQPTGLIIIADDLTGALDTGACFVAPGRRTIATWEAGAQPEGDVWVLDTETRPLPASQAADRVRTLCTPHIDRCGRLYKKLDSTLRGNVGAELAALHALTGQRILLAPAFPAQGRALRDGCLWIHGRLPPAPGLLAPWFAAQSGLACRLLPLSVVRKGPKALVSFLPACPEPAIIAEAETDEDLHALARALTGMGEGWLPAGSAGLASHLASAWMQPAGQWEPLPQIVAPLLWVAGSRQPVLGAQLAALSRERAIMRVDRLLGGLLVNGEEVVAAKAQELARALEAGDALLTTCGEPQIAGGERRTAALLGQIVRGALERSGVGGLILTGGDVALAVCRALGAHAVAVGGLLLPGIPWGRLLGGAAAGTLVVTKAGGFGGEDVFCRIARGLMSSPGSTGGNHDC